MHLFQAVNLIVAGVLLSKAQAAEFSFLQSNNSSNVTVGQAVRTTSGLVHGHAAPNASAVSEYLGIPFAKPPVGPLRFAPPQRYFGCGNLSGESTKRICPQLDVSPNGSLPAASNNSAFPNFLVSLAGLGVNASEDCLTLNVWSKPQTGSKKKPVMVWIYGGGFATGNSYAAAYSGQYWADEEDVVFVNFNYRLGIFGFSGSPSLTQNVGLLDQRLALEWVRDNAEAFGGDPSRIILFGESAGGASTDYYTYAWTADPIIAGTITESGQANSFGNLAPATQAQKWYNVTTTLGCGNHTNQTTEAIVKCMRDPAKVSTADLLRVAGGSGPLSLLLSSFGPTIDNKTVFYNYTQRALDGDFIKTPALVGSNDNEGATVEFIYGLFGSHQPASAWEVITRVIWTCPSNTAAYVRYLNNLPVWRYRYFPSFPNINLKTSIGRAYHLAEVFPLFGTDVDVSRQQATDVEVKLGKYMRNAWAAFAHAPRDGLTQKPFQWPEYSPSVNGTAGLVLLGQNNDTGARFVPRGQFDESCPLLYAGFAAT